MNLLKPKAILFDWDNTLVDSWAVIFDALNFTLESFGKEPWSIAETKARVRKSMRDSFPDLFGVEWEKAAEVFYRRFDDIHISRLKPIEGAQVMLDGILKQGIFMGVVSNKRGDYLRKEVQHLGWGKYFSSLYSKINNSEKGFGFLNAIWMGRSHPPIPCPSLSTRTFVFTLSKSGRRPLSL